MIMKKAGILLTTAILTGAFFTGVGAEDAQFRTLDEI